MLTNKELIAIEEEQRDQEKAISSIEPICQNCLHLGDNYYIIEVYIDGKPVAAEFRACKAVNPWGIDGKGVAVMVQEHSGCQHADDPQFVPHPDVVKMALEVQDAE